MNFILKTRDIILERKMETGVWQKCHVARDNTTPLMRKVPESEGDRMRSALQEVLVSGGGLGGQRALQFTKLLHA